MSRVDALLADYASYHRTRGNLVPIRAERSENRVFADIQQALEQVPAV